MRVLLFVSHLSTYLPVHSSYVLFNFLPIYLCSFLIFIGPFIHFINLFIYLFSRQEDRPCCSFIYLFIY